MDSFLELFESPKITQHLLRQQHRLRAGILAIGLRKRRAAKFGRPHNERLVEHAPRL